MAVISISISESEEQLVAGIPRSISISTNIASTIFYTLDGSDPDVESNIYLSPIILDPSNLSITLKVFATNGVDSSPIIIETYSSNVSEHQRKRSAKTSQTSTSKVKYPFGDGNVGDDTQYSGTSGITISTPNNGSYIDGYGHDGEANSFSDKPFNTENYSIRYSEDWNSNPLDGGIGTLPATVKIIVEDSPENESKIYSNTFDPKAMVMFQDADNETLDDMPLINKGVFSMPNTDHEDYGAQLYSTALEGRSAPTAHFVKSHYNPKTNKITYYYRDSRTNKWIISTQPFNNNGPFNGSLANVILPGRPGSKFVYEWVPHMKRRLI